GRFYEARRIARGGCISRDVINNNRAGGNNAASTDADTAHDDAVHADPSATQNDNRLCGDIPIIRTSGENMLIVPRPVGSINRMGGVVEDLASVSDQYIRFDFNSSVSRQDCVVANVTTICDANMAAAFNANNATYDSAGPDHHITWIGRKVDWPRIDAK